MWTSVMRAVVRRRRVAVTGFVTITVMRFGPVAPQPSTPPPDRRDCPHTWTGGPLLRELAPSSDHIAIAPLKSNVPEFNDCQEFIDSTGTTYLNGLVAVFASDVGGHALWDSLGRLTAGRDTSVSRRGRTQARGAGQSTGRSVGRTPDALAFAEIVHFGASYPALGIAHGFNCLFLFDYDATRPKAVMVPVPSDTSCVLPARSDALLSRPHTNLEVHRITNAKYAATDYPSVARWDWDANHGNQYIGITCGAAWCEVGAPGFDGSAGYTAKGASGPKGRVIEIKGWYDQQRLAIASPTGALMPSAVTGTVFPHPLLDSYTSEVVFLQHWVEVAYVAMSGPLSSYETKLNLGQTPVGTPTNVLYLCKGTKWQCLGFVAYLQSISVTCAVAEPGTVQAGQWWLKVQLGSTVKYRCVSRFVPPAPTPPGFKIVGTTRWRWLAKDETIWEACISGCCQPNGRP
jgi:hypothetical protein